MVAQAFIPHTYERKPEVEMSAAAEAFYRTLAGRRSVRHFSSDPVPLETLRTCVRAAGTAPSGAHKQPWTFVLVRDQKTKHAIRVAAEAEEKEFYATRAPERWKQDLKAMGTHWQKPFIETAPALIAVFAQRSGESKDERHYYVQESVGIAVGMLLSALHTAGVCTLTHTPSPMGFLREVLGRPQNERAYMLIPVGYPAENCEVPNLARKPLEDILVEV